MQSFLLSFIDLYFTCIMDPPHDSKVFNMCVEPVGSSEGGSSAKPPPNGGRRKLRGFVSNQKEAIFSLHPRTTSVFNLICVCGKDVERRKKFKSFSVFNHMKISCMRNENSIIFSYELTSYFQLQVVVNFIHRNPFIVGLFYLENMKRIDFLLF
jgi:hypothetical protein